MLCKRKSRTSVRGKLHHCPTYMRQFSHRRKHTACSSRDSFAYSKTSPRFLSPVFMVFARKAWPRNQVPPTKKKRLLKQAPLKILHDPTIDNFSVFFFFFFTLSTRKIGNRLNLWKINFTFPLTFVLMVSARRPLFDSQQLAFLVVEWVGKNTHYSLPHPLALFLLASLEGPPSQSERLEEAIRHTSIAF